MGIGKLLLYSSVGAVGVTATYIAYDATRPFGVYQRSSILNQAQKEPYKVPTRTEQLSKLDQEFDVLVIGGGATGTGVALDATTRNLRVLLVEQNDFASGSSSRATKMAHGGVRYLERAVFNMDIKELEFVADSLHERKHFFQVAPHLSTGLAMITPCYSYKDLFLNYVGLRLYDFLSGAGARIGNASYVSPSKMVELSPQIIQTGLLGGVQYYDGLFNDARLCLSVALTASALGACVLNHTKVIDLTYDDNSVVNGATVQDALTGKKYQVKAKAVVNATGYFSDTIRNLDYEKNPTSKTLKFQNLIHSSSGVHITLDAEQFTPKNIGVLFPKTKDGRVMFVVPYEQKTIVGTTDVPLKKPITSDLVCVPEDESINFIIEAIRDHFKVDLQRSDVKSAWAGYRPLVGIPVDNDAQQSSTAVLSRDHYIETSPSQMISIMGGKWTTFRRMAEETVDMTMKTKNWPLVKSKTSETVLVGAQREDVDLSDDHLDEKTRKHLKHYYGDKTESILQFAKENNMWGKLSPKLPHLEAEVLHHVRNELACTVNDVLAYRTNMIFLDREEAIKAIPRVADIMGKELGWSSSEKKKQIEQATRYVTTFTK
jgi:glycerol-3-phosphate dehydrogenase